MSLASHVSVLRRNKATNSNTSKDATLLTNNSQHCSMLHVASVCTPCCMLLNVVACCCAKFETGQTFNLVQTDATLLTYNFQHCWELLRPFARSLTVHFSAALKALALGNLFKLFSLDITFTREVCRLRIKMKKIWQSPYSFHYPQWQTARANVMANLE